MSRSWKGRLTTLVFGRGRVLILLFAWMSVDILLHEEHAVWWPALCWLVIIGIATWATVNQRRENRKALADWNARAPEFIVVTADGVSGETAGKTRENLRWTTVKRWREGKSVFLLLFVKGNRTQPLPKSDLSAHQLGELRNLLALYLRPK
jgi:glucose dehydrogenase